MSEVGSALTAPPRVRGAVDRLRPYVPRIATDWLTSNPGRTHLEVEGTLLFSDISGFTRLTERLARNGKVGAEEMSDALDSTFSELLAEAWRDGADLVKWGGDAVLLLFEGPQHAARACRAAHRMRARLATVGKIGTTSGPVVLRMSQGLHSGTFHFFLVGDPLLHRELMVCGPGVSQVLANEAAADAGQIAVGTSTAELLGDGRLLGGALTDDARLLRRAPDTAERAWDRPRTGAADPAICLSAPIRAHLSLRDREPEHRAIAVAFVKFSGTDAMLVERGPTATAAALDAVVRNVAQAVAHHEVTFFESDVDVDGGKVMLTAGAPASAGHDAERLLRASRLIVDRAGELPLRVGVNMGRVFSGDFGPPFRRTYSVKGDAINLAARLAARAGPGQVLATSTVPAHSQTSFAIRALPPMTVKGKRFPVETVDVGPAVGVVPGLASDGPKGPLVGRDHEVAVLAEVLTEVRGRKGRAVRVLGEAGIGKSRLLAELTGMAPDFQVLTVSCDEYESSTPYHALRSLLADLLGIRRGATPEAVYDRLVARVDANAPELEAWIPLLGSVLDVEIPETESTRGLADDFRKQRLEAVAGDFLHALLPTPALLLFDDAQFMDGATADVLERLVRGLAAEPWLLAVAGRDDEGAPLAEADAFTLRPGTLETDESLRLLHAVAHEHPLPRPVAEALAKRSGGNPLFLESLVQLAVGAPGARTSDPEELPESVEDLVNTQIDRLVPADRTVLRYATVLGMRFEVSAVRLLVRGHAPDLGPAVFDRLAEFLVPDRVGGMRFRHAMIRDVAYQGLPYRTRRLLHDQIGTTLESVDAERSPELLSYHFFHAGRFDKAWRYSIDGGRLAKAEYANQEAVELLTRAVEAERRGATGMVPSEELGAVFEDIGDIWFRIGLSDEAATAYRRAARELRHDPVACARVVAKHARVDQRLRKLPQSLVRVTKALNALQPVEGSAAHAARSALAMRYAISRFSQGRIDEALRWGDRAAREAEDAVDRGTLAHAYATLHGIYVAAERPSPLPYGELALQAYTEIGDLYGQADCTNNLAVQALGENRWVDAGERFGAAAVVYRRVGDVQGEGIAIFNQADVLVRQGHLDRVGPLLDEAMWTARSVSDEELVALVLREQGRVAARSGAFPEGLEGLAQARAIFLAIDEEEEVPATDVAICEALMLKGDHRACLEATEPLLHTQDEWVLATVHWIRGFASLALGDLDAAVTEFEVGLASATGIDDRYARALSLIGLAQVRAGDPELAAEADLLLDGLGVVAVPIPGPRSTLPLAKVRGT